MAMPKARADTDFDSWLAQQVDCLRVGRFYDLDPVHLANALEGLGATRRDAVQGDLVRILEYLICLELSPAQAAVADWKAEAAARRTSLNAKIAASPTLRKVVADTLPGAYERARGYASIALSRDGVAKADIPQSCSYQLETVLDEDWWPTNRHGLGVGAGGAS